MVIITGASRGIGKYLFESFVDTGEKVFGTYHMTNPAGENASTYAKVDIANHEEVRAWISKLPLDNKLVLINCAGINANSMVHKFDEKKWKDVINTNLTGTFNVISSFIPRMRESGFGRIINFSSVVGQMGIPGTSAYASSKAALWGLSRAVAAENASKGITINNINLGYFDIGMISEVPDEYKKIILAKIPSGRFGNPKEIFETVKYMINCEYLNGTSIDLNGGLF